jgi:hypothetical protein
MRGTSTRTSTLRAYRLQQGRQKKRKNYELVLYMAPYSEWTGCGSGITNNCEWLTPEKERRQILIRRSSGNTGQENKVLQQKKQKHLLPSQTMLYRRITMRTPSYVRGHAKKFQSENNTKRLQPPTGTCRQIIRRKCALLVARPARAPNRWVRTEAIL